MLEERPFGDADEALTPKPRQTEKVVQDVVNSSLVERLLVDEDGELESGDRDAAGVLLDCWVEESEEEWVENPGTQSLEVERNGVDVGTNLRYDLRLHRIQASPARRVLRSSALRLSSIMNMGVRSTRPGS